jgi:hypothetical protein
VGLPCGPGLGGRSSLLYVVVGLIGEVTAGLPVVGCGVGVLWVIFVRFAV